MAEPEELGSPCKLPTETCLLLYVGAGKREQRNAASYAESRLTSGSKEDSEDEEDNDSDSSDANVDSPRPRHTTRNHTQQDLVKDASEL